MIEPVKVRVPAPCDAFPAMHFTLRTRADAILRMKVLLRDITRVVEADDTKLHLLLQAAHWAEAVDHLLDGLLEVTRREEEREVEQSWWGDLPAWPEDEESSEGVAAA